MTRNFLRRCRGSEPDAGVYAVLYAVLVIVLIGMGAIVVDFASVRQDRRLDRSATDSAVLGAGAFLNPQGTGGIQPKAACLRAWDYLATTLRISIPASACSAFNGVVAATYCASVSPPEIADNRTVGSRIVRISWPIPRTGGSGFLNPDLAPGAVQQTFSSDIDGSDNGCDRIGAAVFETPTFLLGGALGSRGTNIQVHSVARFNVDGGPAEEVAALNVLNPLACRSLVTQGGGKVLVAPTLDRSTVPPTKVGPGIIAVESAGSIACNNATQAVIAPNTSSGGSLICASNTILNPLLPNGGCDGQGLIRSHAMDPGGLHPYNLAAVPANLLPTPVPENGTNGWNPVTHLYGCVALVPCADGSAAPSGYIKTLNTAFGGVGSPSPYLGVSPYNNLTASQAFQPVPASVCAAIKTTVQLPTAGNWYANCQINVANGGALIVPGGSLVVEAGISVASGGCLVMNVDTTQCQAGTPNSPPLVNPSGSDATTNPAPSSDAIVYLRGNGCPVSGSTTVCFSTAGKTIMPQTFVYSGGGLLNVNSTDVTLWTAPGAGAINGGKTTLEAACTLSAPAASPDADCLNSRFARLAYWNESPALNTNPDSFLGQGALSVVGVFFIPRAYFDINGGGTYAAASAQFWADQVRVKGGAFLGLLPDTRTAISSPTGATTLIR